MQNTQLMQYLIPCNELFGKFKDFFKKRASHDLYSFKKIWIQVTYKKTF